MTASESTMTVSTITTAILARAGSTLGPNTRGAIKCTSVCTSRPANSAGNRCHTTATRSPVAVIITAALSERAPITLGVGIIRSPLLGIDDQHRLAYHPALF